MRDLVSQLTFFSPCLSACLSAGCGGGCLWSLDFICTASSKTKPSASNKDWEKKRGGRGGDGKCQAMLLSNNIYSHIKIRAHSQRTSGGGESQVNLLSSLAIRKTTDSQTSAFQKAQASCGNGHYDSWFNLTLLSSNPDSLEQRKNERIFKSRRAQWGM